jgi:magnesium chelatase subunit I
MFASFSPRYDAPGSGRCAPSKDDTEGAMAQSKRSRVTHKAARADTEDFHILPYTRIVGQAQLKLALELAFVAPGIGGVLISGDRGTAKSTAVRAFARMINGGLPVTLPINATEDRVVGGWRVESLLRGKFEEERGLLEEANGKVLYVDEVNLLDDHVVNMILDVSSTGVLDVQRDGASRRREVRFTLVGTMNPEEGNLRPQLLDRFGLMVGVATESDPKRRLEILRAVVEFDRTRELDKKARDDARRADDTADASLKRVLERARGLVDTITLSDGAYDRCIALVRAFESQGHRGEQAMALAAKAQVAIEIAKGGSRPAVVSPADVTSVAPLALRHRRKKGTRADATDWTTEDQNKLNAPPTSSALPS